MAVLAVKTMVEVQDGQKHIHPFFNKSSRTKQVNSRSIDEQHHDSTTQNEANPAKDKGPGLLDHELSRQLTQLNSDTASRNEQASDTAKPSRDGQETFDVDLNQDRRKRRKTNSPSNKITAYTTKSSANDAADLEVEDDVQARFIAPVPKGKKLSRESSPIKSTQHEIVESVTVGSEDATRESSIATTEVTSVPEQLVSDLSGPPGYDPLLEQVRNKSSPKKSPRPQKILQLNSRTGTIGSPPAKTQSSMAHGPSDRIPQLGRKRRPRSFVVKIAYGNNSETRTSLGGKIDQILSTSKSLQTASIVSATEVLPKMPAMPKSTHPFFLGKAALRQDLAEAPTTANDENKKPSEMKSSAVKPSFFPLMGRSTPLASKPGANGSTSSLLHSSHGSRIIKFPGAIEPIWPPSGMIHIRGEMLPVSANTQSVFSIQSERKSKHAAMEPRAEEDILNVIASWLNIPRVVEEIFIVDTDNFSVPEECLRLPIKHFESGFALQSRVRNQLSVRLPTSSMSQSVMSSDDELAGGSQGKCRVHPAILKVYNMIPTSLTAFDQSQYETKSWVHKYAPSAAAEVLQKGREALILRDWLKALTVMAVDKGYESSKSRAGSVAGRRSKTSKVDKSVKRKRKSKKLDGFVVSSDEEADDMDEISEPEEDESPRGSQGAHRKTVVRSGDLFKASKDSNKLTNAVVISGPNGCGKTATVYAVAKELGFEVFEINSSSRRSGKDVLERVGDMTRNHLVHQAQEEAMPNSQDEALQRATDVLDEDLKSGRQGTMNSFFIPITSSKQKPSARGRKPAEVKTTVNQISQSSPRRAKQQRQSLILFEEVDVLYEEDKQFWATVMTLITQSKRPVIMTCNDEALLPLQALSLHAIIRLAPPPMDLAVDYMLLVAANEGHALRRSAIKALYGAHKFDLRASLTELEFWCQIGVGDRRGGFEWFYPRLPHGIDKDTDGNIIRVVSERTYQTGMGWLSQDHICDKSQASGKEVEILQEACYGWDVDVGDWHETLELSIWADDLKSNSEVSSKHILSAYEAFADAMSTADMCASGSYASDNLLPLDTTDPNLTPKTRDDFILGYELLEYSTPTRYNGLAADLSLGIKAEARCRLQSSFCQILQEEQPLLNTPKENDLISLIIKDQVSQEESITRYDYSLAFDPIASDDRNFIHAPTSLEPSCFDLPMASISTDIAPYIRSIVTYDAKLQAERARLSNLLSEGGRRGKRQRTTRSALSALEGGKRNTTRRERWFNEKLNPQLVLRTGLETWQDALSAETTLQKACLKEQQTTNSEAHGESDSN